MSEDERILGKISGAIRRADGTIKLAPMYAAPFQRLLDRENGLRTYIDQLNRFIADEYADITAQHRELGQRIRADLDLPAEPMFSLSLRGGTDLVLTFQKDEEAAS